jgi:hypothetical protein
LTPEKTRADELFHQLVDGWPHQDHLGFILQLRELRRELAPPSRQRMRESATWLKNRERHDVMCEALDRLGKNWTDDEAADWASERLKGSWAEGSLTTMKWAFKEHQKYLGEYRRPRKPRGANKPRG